MFVDSYPSIPAQHQLHSSFGAIKTLSIQSIPSQIPSIPAVVGAFEKLSLGTGTPANWGPNLDLLPNPNPIANPISNPSWGYQFERTSSGMQEQQGSVLSPLQQNESMTAPNPNPTPIASTPAFYSNPSPAELIQSLSTHPPTMTTTTPPHPGTSLQSRLTTRTTLLPLSLLLRPLPPTPLDQTKLYSMVQTLSEMPPEQQNLLPPIDVLYYKSPQTGKEFYFAFGGCHRLGAWQAAGREMVECKVVKVTRGMLGGYLGGSLGRVLGEE